MATRLIAGGARVQVLINGAPVGLATNASYDEDWGIQGAQVLNYLGPITYDSQNYSCSISLGTYIPEVPGSGPWADGGATALADYLPTRTIVAQDQGQPGMFDTLQFLNTHTGKVINQFRNVMIASNGTQLSPGSYVTANVRLMAVERTV
jgi:hypothetical protein